MMLIKACDLLRILHMAVQSGGKSRNFEVNSVLERELFSFSVVRRL
jgi:hypothetical protein